jgi:pimeloyl-ACP methyl ester carboxylesterase
MNLTVTPLGTLSQAAADRAATLPLVLLHAFPLDHRMWEPVADQLVDLPLLLMDLPGAGMSPVVQPTMAAAADAVAATAQTLGYSRLVVAGVSLGGYVAMAFARAHPEALAGVGLVDTKPTADDPAARASRHDVARRVLELDSVAPVLGMAESLVGVTTRADRPAVVGQLRAWIASGDAAGVAWAQAAMAARPDSTQTLRDLRVPVAVIVGEEDQLSPPEVAREMAAAAPGVVLTVVPRAGHLSPVERPDAVAEALRNLYRRADL